MNAPNFASLPEGDALLSQLGQRRPTGARRWLRTGLVGLAVALGIGALIALTRQGNAAPVRYLTQPISRGDLVTTVTASGTLRAKDSASVGVEVSGRVIAVNADFNEPVSKGQVLVELDPAPLKAQLLQRRAQLASAKADLANRPKGHRR